jgi:hypothetical protein
MSGFHRVRQTFAALTVRPDTQCAELVEKVLSPNQAAAFRELAAHDQAHLCRVAQQIGGTSNRNTELIVAALLHDIGKVSDRGRVRLPDRIAKVLLANYAPNLLARLAIRPANRALEGLSLAVHHAALGAERAAKLGCSPRTCWLIAHHDDAGSFSDQDLCLLVAADRETV